MPGVKRSADGSVVPAAKHFKPEIDTRRPLHGHHHGKVVRQALGPQSNYTIYSNCDRRAYPIDDFEHVPKFAQIRLVQGTDLLNVHNPNDDASCQEVCSPFIDLPFQRTTHCFTTANHTVYGQNFTEVDFGNNQIGFFGANATGFPYARTGQYASCRASQGNFSDPGPFGFDDLIITRHLAINNTFGPNDREVAEGAPCPKPPLPTPTPTPVLTSSESAILPTGTPGIGDQSMEPPNNGTSGLLLATLVPSTVLIGGAALILAAYGVYRGVKWLSKPSPAERYTVTPAKHQNPMEEPVDASEAFANRYSSFDAPDGDDKSIELANPVYEVVGDADLKRTDV